MIGNNDEGESGKRREASEEEDRDGPLFVALGFKLVLMVVVLWLATPYSGH